MITREEGERLIAFTSTASPLFIFGAIAVGFFENASLGIILALHIISVVFWLASSCDFINSDPGSTPAYKENDDFLLLRAFNSMHRARVRRWTSVGTTVGRSSHLSCSNIVVNWRIYHFILGFNPLIDHIGIHIIFSYLFAQLFEWLSFPLPFPNHFLLGSLEIDLRFTDD